MTPLHDLFAIFLLFSAKMVLFLFLSTADTALGRFDAHTMPHQYLIEMLVRDLDDVSIAKDTDGNFLEIEKWSILKFNTDGDVVSIFIDSHNIGVPAYLQEYYPKSTIERWSFAKGGKLNYQYIPPTVTLFNAKSMNLHGEIETTKLPRGLQKFYVSSNRHTGAFDVRGLPEGMLNIDISQNKMSGSLEMDALPEPMETFDAWDNEFSGAVNLTKLPRNLSTLSLSSNRLEGRLELRNVPESLMDVGMNSNNFDKETMVFDGNHRMLRFGVDGLPHIKIIGPGGAVITYEDILILPILGLDEE